MCLSFESDEGIDKISTREHCNNKTFEYFTLNPIDDQCYLYIDERYYLKERRYIFMNVIL